MHIYSRNDLAERGDRLYKEKQEVIKELEKTKRELQFTQLELKGKNELIEELLIQRQQCLDHIKGYKHE